MISETIRTGRITHYSTEFVNDDLGRTCTLWTLENGNPILRVTTDATGPVFQTLAEALTFVAGYLHSH